MIDRLKEIKKEVYLQMQIINNAKKEIKRLHQEANMIQGYKNLEKGCDGRRR